MNYFIYLFCLTLFLPFGLSAQPYKIIMVDHTTPDGKPDAKAKPIPFIITLRDTVLKSGPDGAIYISADVYEKRKDCMVRDFSFYLPEDAQKYSEPSFTNTVRKLMDYCDERVLVAEKKMAGE